MNKAQILDNKITQLQNLLADTTESEATVNNTPITWSEKISRLKNKLKNAMAIHDRTGK